jgi:Arc/MetJ-type ribon-helix-helix transcriptional regulator
MSGLASMAVGEGNTQFSITLPDETLAMFEQLYSSGLYGKNRSEVARQLILDMLKNLVSQNVIRLPSR